MLLLPSPQRAFFFLLLLSALTFSASASALADVDGVNAALKQAEASLTLVDGAIGSRTTPPKGSAAKLAKMRLGQALPFLEKAGKLVPGLKGGADAAKAKARYEAADALYQRLNGILTGAAPKPAPQPAPKPAPKPNPSTGSSTGSSTGPSTGPATGPATVKLGYPHADNFKNALFTLRRVESDSNALIKLMAEVHLIEDQLSIKYGTAAQAAERAQEGLRQAGFADTALGKVPSNGEGVAEAKQRLVLAKQALNDSAAYFKPLHAKLGEVINPANYPDLQGDLKRLRELSGTYRNVEYLLQRDLEQGAAAFAQREASLTESRRIAAAYARLIQQDTDAGRSVKGGCEAFEGYLQAFHGACAEARTSLPKEIQTGSLEVKRMADEAVREQQPMWFTGGIPQQMGSIEGKLALLEVLDPAGGAKVAPQVDQLKGDLAVQADGLKELIIRQNPLPNDNYSAADRDAIVAIAKDAWRLQESDHELLAVRIPSDTWDRSTSWNYSNGSWYFNDVSSVQVRLIVADKENSEQAIDRPINVRKDHTKGDKLYGVPLRSFDEKLQPREYLLRTRVK